MNVNWNFECYINRREYNKDTIIKDIDETFNNNVNYVFLNKELELYFKDMIDYAIKFIDIFYDNNTYPLEYKALLLYKYIPFRYSNNVLVDKHLIEKDKHVNNITVGEGICYLLKKYNDGIYSNNGVAKEIDDYFKRTVSFDIIYSKGKLFGNIGRMPRDEETIRFDYEQHYDFGNNIVEPTQIIGNYGELLFYNKLKEDYDENDIIWVSKDLGDGYGYDIALFDRNKGKALLYEVKASEIASKSPSISLTKTENMAKDRIIKTTDSEYHGVKVYINSDKEMEYYCEYNYNNNAVIDSKGYNRLVLVCEDGTRKLF